jgi:hypothetical protein
VVLYLSWRVGQIAGIKLPAFRKPNVIANGKKNENNQSINLVDPFSRLQKGRNF